MSARAEHSTSDLDDPGYGRGLLEVVIGDDDLGRLQQVGAVRSADGRAPDRCRNRRRTPATGTPTSSPSALPSSPPCSLSLRVAMRRTSNSWKMATGRPAERACGRSGTPGRSAPLPPLLRDASMPRPRPPPRSTRRSWSSLHYALFDRMTEVPSALLQADQHLVALLEFGYRYRAVRGAQAYGLRVLQDGGVASCRPPPPPPGAADAPRSWHGRPRPAGVRPSVSTARSSVPPFTSERYFVRPSEPST